ncbi:TetR/AcrR family transcriptional regulator [Streptomyces phaeochromogenes]|uniref:TetR/AcrR family transcriptional regulator n=1 Tax=Streptomyces TaxID=1883 RepID=UPI002E2B7320|nr:TetR/AcrR family transcriptional regulator [Streptomyces phaeochromogenes]
MARPQQERAAKTRDRILVGAASVFANHGFGASINDIVKASGITQGSIYYHFPTGKIAIAEAVVHAGLLLGEAGTVQASGLQGAVDLSISVAVLLPKVPAVRAGTRLATEPGTPFYGLLWKNYIPYAQGMLEHAQNQGELLPGVKPDELALQWIAAWTGHDVMHRLDPEKIPAAIAGLNRWIAAMCATNKTLRELDLSVERGEELTAGHPMLLVAQAVFQDKDD